MNRAIMLGIFTLMTQSCQAALTTTATLDAAHTLTVRPPAGYHFNLDAPAPQVKATTSAGDQELKPAKISEHEVSLALPAGTTKLSARWFVCDDGKAMCMAVREELAIEGDKVTAREAKDAAPHGTDAPSTAPAAAGAVAHGFLVDRPDEALAQAKKERRPLIIDFFGIWCPPCNALDETVFSRPEFSSAAETFVKLKLDADRESSWALKERYRIGGYPTVIFANADGEEIDRVVGSRSLKQFVALTADALAHQNQPRAVLEKLAASDLAADRRLAGMQLEHQENAAVVDRFSKRQTANAATFTAEDAALLWRARVGAAKDAVKAAADGKGDAKVARASYEDALKAAIAALPGTSHVLDWTNALADLLDEDGDAAGAQAAWHTMHDTAKALFDKPDVLAADGLTLADLWQYRASALESLKDDAGAKAAFAGGAAAYEADIKEGGLSADTARGFNIERAYCLGKAGQVAAAFALYEKLEAAYPKEFTFLFAHAGLLQSEKKLEEAEAIGRRAYEASYGDNRLRAAERLAKILLDRGQRDAARAIIDEALAGAKEPSDPFNRTLRYIKILKKLKKA